MNLITVPQKVYKFMDPYYLNLLKRDKKFYINHLNNYKEDELGSEVGDDKEGILTTKVAIEKYTFGSGNNVAFENSFNNIQEIFDVRGNNVTIKNGTLETRYSNRNFFVYCVCTEYDQKVKKEFGGSTLIIEDFPKFLNYLNRKLNKQGKELVIAGNCKYIKGRINTFTEKQNFYNMDFPPLVKDDRYAYQKEFRVLWRNLDDSPITEPISVYSQEALQQCTFEF